MRLIAIAAALGAGGAAADGGQRATELAEVVVSSGHYDNSVGGSDAASQGSVRAALLESRAALRPGEVLEFVPGMIVTQHSGDGKANQYFLRGFNLDHGTDFATTVAGVPVNLPSHAHGQGYSDLNFLIPELVERIDYRKGPYFATDGDFSAAGAADIVYKARLESPFAQLTLGQRGYRRAVAGSSWQLQPDIVLTGVVEVMGNDGPWTVPENLQRRNAVLSVAQGTKAEGWGLRAMAYDAQWTATDQIPQRLLDAGNYQGRPFGRFDSLDPSAGGDTRRLSLSGEWHRRDGSGETSVSAYAMQYRLKLFSNFTWALERPDSGDQFSQQDSREVQGLQARRAWNHGLAGIDAVSELGVQIRHDEIRVGLFDSRERALLATVRDDRIRQTISGLYGQTRLMLQPWLQAIAGLRADRADFRIDGLKGDAVARANSGQSSAGLVSPKFGLIAGPWARTELFLNAGQGFHSNDARGTTARVDPRTGEAVDPVRGLVPARGWEVGVRSEAIAGLQSSVALWQLRSDSELVYVGDAGTTEPGLGSRRRGIEWNNRWKPNRRWLLDADLAWTHARFDSGDRIPNAVDKVASVALTRKDLGPWSASLQWRYLGSGALVEDGSMRSQPSSTLNLRLTRHLADLPRKAWLTLDVFNLTDRQASDIQYWYRSRLPGEAAAVDDRIIHPAEPRSLRLTLRAGF